jgi:hypothetical protein
MLSKTPTTRRIEFPDDQSIVQSVEESTSGEHTVKTKIGKHTTAFIAKLLALRGRVSEEERSRIDKALASVDLTRSTATARVMTRELLDKYGIRGLNDGNRRRIKNRKQSRRLDSTLTSIREGCESTRDLELPHLSNVESIEAVTTLLISMELMSKLIRRLLGVTEEEEGADQ